MRGGTEAVARPLGPGELPRADAKIGWCSVYSRLFRSKYFRASVDPAASSPEATSSKNEVMRWRDSCGAAATNTGMSTTAPANRAIRWRAVPRNKKNKEASAIATIAPRDRAGSLEFL
jgi:hypothetical protein